jgi:hypothetical protein
VGKTPVEVSGATDNPVDTSVDVEKRPDLFPSLFENVAVAGGVRTTEDTVVPPVE